MENAQIGQHGTEVPVLGDLLDAVARRLPLLEEVLGFSVDGHEGRGEVLSLLHQVLHRHVEGARRGLILQAYLLVVGKRCLGYGDGLGVGASHQNSQGHQGDCRILHDLSRFQGVRFERHP